MPDQSNAGCAICAQVSVVPPRACFLSASNISSDVAKLSPNACSVALLAAQLLSWLIQPGEFCARAREAITAPIAMAITSTAPTTLNEFFVMFNPLRKREHV